MMVLGFQRALRCTRMKSSSAGSVSLPESASCIVPYFSPREYVRQIGGFDEVIDVRSPAEFADDHIPGAINLPVLNNAERAEVGTLHNSRENGVSLKPRARQLGAAYISANTSQHLLKHFLGKELTYKPLIYCWRGGQRSRSMAIILKEIGFCPSILQGGWRDYRKLVRDGVTLMEDPDRVDFLDDCKIILVSGTTGSGKSLLLETLEKAGEQVIHLERLAKHKGSTLGNYPGEAQPTQKMFESLLWHQIQFELDPKKVIWVENESAKVGKIAVPNRLWRKMCQSPRIHMVVQLEDRVKFTMGDYSYFCDKDNAANSAGSLEDLLGRLEKHAGKQKPKEWIQLAKEGNFEKLTRELIVEYYDKNYKKPRGDPLATYEVPPGLILAPEELLCSSLLEEIVKFGNDYLNTVSDGGNENTGEEKTGKLQLISDNVETSELSRMMAMAEWVKTIGMSTHLAVATFLRLVLIAYGQQQDMMMEVKYTDVDYRVFTDGARHVWEGGSPYDRHTYRYSPLLAYMMIPNMWSPSIGKLVFVMFDILAGQLIYCILRSEATVSEGMSRLAACAWLHNPLVMNVSTRGSAESVIVALVLLTIHLYQQKVFLLTGLIYGLAIHLKIYPLIFCLSLYVPLTQKSGLISLFDVNVARIRLVSGTIFSLLMLTLLCHHLYGWQFIEETYLYHITRKDSRHNFSVYFYMLYLTVGDDDIGLNVLAFLPQVVLILLLTYKYSSIYEVNFCLFCQTLVFVTFNKVVTAQYFLWYLSLLPLILPSLLISAKQLLLGALLWGFAQASWLLPAYLLEFKGNNTFLFIWLESLAFFCANVTILARLIRKQRESREKINLQCDLHKID